MRSNHLNEIMTVDNPNALSHVPGPAELIRVKTVPRCRGYPGIIWRVSIFVENAARPGNVLNHNCIYKLKAQDC